MHRTFFFHQTGRCGAEMTGQSNRGWRGVTKTNRRRKTAWKLRTKMRCSIENEEIYSLLYDLSCSNSAFHSWRTDGWQMRTKHRAGRGQDEGLWHSTHAVNYSSWAVLLLNGLFRSAHYPSGENSYTRLFNTPLHWSRLLLPLCYSLTTSDLFSLSWPLLTSSCREMLIPRRLNGHGEQPAPFFFYSEILSWPFSVASPIRWSRNKPLTSTLVMERDSVPTGDLLRQLDRC